MTDSKQSSRSTSVASFAAPAKSLAAHSSASTPAGAVPKRLSAANLSVPTKRLKQVSRAEGAACEPAKSKKAWKQSVALIRKLRDSFPPEVNKNDRAIALISACIGGGICTEKKIITVLVALSFNPVHIYKILKSGTGNSANARWSKGADGRYRLLG